MTEGCKSCSDLMRASDLDQGNFGAFVEILPRKEGLVPFTRLS